MTNWVATWEKAEAAGRFNKRNLSLDFCRHPAVDRLYLAAKAFEQDAVWPPKPHLPFPLNEADCLFELYNHLRYYIGLLTDYPKPERFLKEYRKVRFPQKTDDQNARLEAFLYDPEVSMRRFLSFYLRDTGNLWKRRWCHDAAHLTDFFIQFLIRIGFHDDEDVSQKLVDTSRLIALAKVELPATQHISLNLPCVFSRGCSALWGREGGGQSPEFNATQTSAEPSDDLDAHISSLVAEMQSHFSAFIPPDLFGAADDMDVNPVFDFEAAWADPDAEPNEGTWQEGGGGLSLMTILGPTTLPHTHAAGLVERSTRRIAEVIRPTSMLEAVNGTRSHDDTEVDAAEAVEEELDRRLGKVVLTPWMRLDRNVNALTDIMEPEILSSPLDTDAARRMKDPDQSHMNSGSHNPLVGGITVLVEPSLLDQLIVGMGIGGTWVQIIPRQKNGELGRYWYTDHVIQVLPSFYLDS